MNLDDEICLCFHVTKRKVVNFARIEKPKRASQMTGCFGAGTGCGWCRPFLEKIFLQETGVTDPEKDAFPTVEEYSELRKQHIREGKGKAPKGSDT